MQTRPQIESRLGRHTFQCLTTLFNSWHQVICGYDHCDGTTLDDEHLHSMLQPWHKTLFYKTPVQMTTMLLITFMLLL